jgi:hypothetical protein
LRDDPGVDAIEPVLLTTGLILVFGSLVGLFATGQYAALLRHQLPQLRRRHGLDGPRFTEVYRAVHSGAAAPPPLRAAAHDYAAAVLRSSDRAVFPLTSLLGFAGMVLIQTLPLTDGLDRPTDWVVLAITTFLTTMLIWALIARVRRTTRARQALAANQ